MSNPDVEVEQGLEGSPDEAQEWRRARFEELGFTGPEALALANAKQVEYTGKGTDKEPRKEWHQPLSWKKVQKTLESGCSREMALQIFID